MAALAAAMGLIDVLGNVRIRNLSDRRDRPIALNYLSNSPPQAPDEIEKTF
jgi:hypothetical protein